MLVTKKRIRVGNRIINAGNITDAAELCGLRHEDPRRNANAYRLYKRTQGAPGPISRSSSDGDSGPVLDERRRPLYDLDAVLRWHRQRPGRGARRELQRGAEDLRATELRRALLRRAESGTLRLDPASGLIAARVKLPGGPATPARRSRQTAELRVLQRVGALGEPSVAGGVVELTETGRELLARWR